jgi:(S)-ureidoglycine aminohydrolase
MQGEPLQHLGATRSRITASHLLQTPDTFVRTQMPGMVKSAAIVHAGPALGAGFMQYTAEMEAGGMLGPTKAQRFLYVLEGKLEVSLRAKYKLGVAGFAFLPQGAAHTVKATAASRVAVFEKYYQPLPGVRAPKAIFSNEEKVASQALMGDTDLQVRCLLPDSPEFDFAVNTMEYQPGAALSMVEVHVMEHGMLMLAGGGIYRLGEDWYPVQAGDFIWMGAWCPQWFGALGKTPAKYLIYKDWNRSAL